MIHQLLTKSTKLLCGLALLAVGASCSNDRAEEWARQQAERTHHSQLDSILALGGELPQGTLRAFSPQEKVEDILQEGKQIIEHKPSGSPEVLTPGYYRKVLRSYDLQGYELQDQYTGHLPADVVWPGSLIYAHSATSSSLVGLTELNAYRTPGKVTMAVINGAKNLSCTLRDYHYSAVNKELNELVASVGTDLPAQISYSVHSVRTLGEAAYYLGISQEELERNEKYKEFRDVHWQDNTFKAVINFSQDFFTLVYDDPDGATSLFDSALPPNLLARYTGRGKPLGYISSVTYGRRFSAIIEETKRTYRQQEDLKKSITGTLSRTPALASAPEKHPDTPAIPSPPTSSLRHVRIYLHLEGGKNIFSTQISAIPTMKELEAFVTASAKDAGVRYGVPAACTIKYLHGLKPLAVPRTISGKYSFVDYIPQEDDNQLTLSGLRLRGFLRSDRPVGGNYPRIYWAYAALKELSLTYKHADKAETKISLLAPRDYDFRNGGFDIAIPPQALPAFGATPTGYLRLTMRGTFHVRRSSKGGSPYKGQQKEFYRSVYFRYSPLSKSWYYDPDYKEAQDTAFDHIGLDLDEDFCQAKILLYYRISSALQGTMPYRHSH